MGIVRSEDPRSWGSPRCLRSTTSEDARRAPSCRWTIRDWREHITVDPNVCHGQACVAGTRVPVTVILVNLAAGLTHAEIRESYPTVPPDAIPAALRYAAELARERVATPGP